MIDFTEVAARWLILATRYRRIMKRVVADVDRAHYVGGALRKLPGEGSDAADFVEAFANKIPKTHGAPKRQPASSA